MWCFEKWVCKIKKIGYYAKIDGLCCTCECSRASMPTSYLWNCLTGHVAVAERNDLFGKKGLAMTTKAIIKTDDAKNGLWSMTSSKL